ncbi:MAG: hypothetical protein ACLSGM_00890 [Thomasclavelia sp.]
MCKHEWVLIERPRHIKYDYDGCEVVIGKCRCTKCKKIKDRKMIGHQIGNIFEEVNT